MKPNKIITFLGTAPNWLIALVGIGLCTLLLCPAQGGTLVIPSTERVLPKELALAIKCSPIPPIPQDPTNKYIGLTAAIDLGRLLFNDVRLSASGDMACSSCHQVEHGWSDGKPIASSATGDGLRRTPSIKNSIYFKWYGWDGAADSLWFQSLRPIENPNEMASDRIDVAAVIVNDEKLKIHFIDLFGIEEFKQCQTAANPVLPSTLKKASATHCLINVSKAIAAYIATIVSKPNRFDFFVQNIKAGKPLEKAGLTQTELLGLKIFFGDGKCFTCHTGPLFSNSDFHNLAIYPRTKSGWLDSGRLGGIRSVLSSEFNQINALQKIRSGRSSLTAFLQEDPGAWGQFKTPSLRNTAGQKYFMHQGQFASLGEVVDFYSDFKGMDFTDHHRELSLNPLRLNSAQKQALVAILNVIGE